MTPEVKRYLRAAAVVFVVGGCLSLLQIVLSLVLPMVWAWAATSVAALLMGIALYAALRRETEQALELQTAETLAGFFSVLPGIWYESRVRPDGTSELLQVNDAVRPILGLEPAELLKDVRLFSGLMHPDDRPRIIQGVIDHTQTLEPWLAEYRLNTPHRGTIWIKSQASLTRAEDGSTIWRGFISDITHRKESEEALRKSEGTLALATQAGKVGTWDYDMVTEAISWNEVQFEIHGLDPKTYKPTLANNTNLLHPDDKPRVDAGFARCLESGETNYEVECRIIRPDGTIRHTKSAGIILRDPSGQPIRVVGTEIDITDEKELAQALGRARDHAEAATRAKSEFLAMMSHEIRTPMNGIMGFAALLKETKLSEEQQDFVNTIELSAESLLLLIGDILDLSKVEANQMKIDPVSFDLAQCVREIASLFRPRALEKGLSYHYEIESSAPQLIWTDRLRFLQILTNLIGNAIKFTSAGSVHLKVRATPVEGDTKQWKWQFLVEDTGCGIPPEVRKQLFTPFYQADSSAARQHGGTGLGLAISRRLAELLGGEITLADESANGATFIFSLTCPEIPPEMSLAEPGLPPSTSTGSLHGKRILVVEDHPINLKLCLLHLRHLDCLGDPAETGFQALAKVRAGEYDLILMDMQLPGMDGCETTREIRRLQNGSKRTPIIAMTANAMREDRLACLAAGMDDYLSKPIKLEVLAAMLAKWS